MENATIFDPQRKFLTPEIIKTQKLEPLHQRILFTNVFKTSSKALAVSRDLITVNVVLKFRKTTIKEGFFALEKEDGVCTVQTLDQTRDEICCFE